MIEIKYHLGKSKIHNISLEDFVKTTKEKEPYYINDKNGKSAYAICPLCENPVRLLGIYIPLNKQAAHARHAKHDISGLAIHDQNTYLNCPNHREHGDYLIEPRNPANITPINTEILHLAHDYFDKCIYIIRKTTGLVISDSLAERIAQDYMAHPGYMTYDITRENVPYIMALCMTGVGLVKRKIEKDSPIYKMLETKKEISLIPDTKTKAGIQLYRVESKIGYLELMFNITNYRFRSDATSGLKEYLKLHIGTPDGNGTYDTYAEKEIEVDPFFFNKMIHSKKALPPRREMADIADKYLVI